MSEKLSERMHEAAVGGLGYIQDLDEWSEEVAALEARLETVERMLSRLNAIMHEVVALEAKLEVMEREKNAYKDLCTAYRTGSHSRADKALTVLDELRDAAQKEQR